MITIVEIWMTREAYSGNQACQEYKLKYYEQYNKIKHAVSLKGVNLGVDVVFSNAIVLIVLLLVDIALEIHAYCFFRIIIFSYLPCHEVGNHSWIISLFNWHHVQLMNFGSVRIR